MDKKTLVVLVFTALVGTVDCRSDIKPVIRFEVSGGAGHFNYAPSAIQDEKGIRYLFVCQNKEPYVVRDHIYLFKGILAENGYVWQPGIEILAPSEDGWDKIHVCDPDVREFKTTYKGETYNWMMTYLGVDQWKNKNQIGLAVAKNVEGPYIKIDKNPLIPYENPQKWGVGQSTTVVKDSTTIQLFYASTTENGPFCVREIKLNDLENIVLGEEKNIPFLRPNSYPSLSEKNIYMVSEMRESPITEVPTWVGDVCRLTCKPRKECLFTDMLDKTDGWIKIGQVGSGETGFARNHNPGILTDTKGYMLRTGELVMYFTVATTGENWLWSYDLYSATFDIRNFEF